MPDKFKWIPFAVAALLAFPGAASAEPYPTRPIEVIVPASPGGTYDNIARLMQRDFRANQRLSQTLVVQNLPGAGGTFGTTRIKDAPADGYTIGIWNPGLVTAKLFGNADYDHEAFSIIGATGIVETGLGANADSRIESIETLLAELRREPGSLKVATNLGLPVHVFPLMFAEEAGIEFRFVQTGSGSKRLASLLGGHTDTALFSLLEFESYRKPDLQSSGIKPLVLFSKKRSPKFPDTPTAIELGYNFAATESPIWLAPKDTPPEILDTLRAALRNALQDPALVADFKAMGMDAAFIDASECEAYLDDLSRRCASIPKAKLAVSDSVPINFPLALLAVTAACAIAYVASLRKAGSGVAAWTYQREPWRAVWFLAIGALYVAVLPFVEFSVATFAFFAASGAALIGFKLNARDAARIGLLAFAFEVGAYLLLVNGLGMELR